MTIVKINRVKSAVLGALIPLFLTSNAFANLARNADFENGNNNWNLYSGAQRVTNNVQSGSYAVKLTNQNGAEQTITNLKPNTTYKLTAWAKVTGADSMRIGVKRHGGNTKSHSFSSRDYTKGEITFTTGFAANSAIIYAYKPGQNGDGYVDNFSLTEVGKSPYNLLWSDEFNGSGPFDSNVWGHERGFVRNKELQWYQKENAYQENGHLVIEGRKERRANPNYQAGSSDWKKSRQYINYTSSSLTSRKSHTWKYGRMVVRAKVTNHTGTWPAIWTLGTSCEWPSNGEVDVMENYGGKILANFAWGTDTRWRARWDGANKQVRNLRRNWANDWHIWELDWDKDRMTISLDGQFMNEVLLKNTFNGSSKCAGQNPFRQEHYVILNLALGGNAGSVNNLRFPTRYLVDYVRVYQKGATPPPPSSNDGNNGNVGNQASKVEAESANLYGGSTTFNDSSASNGQGVAYLSSPGAGFSISNAPAAKTIRVRYASPRGGRISVFVDGQNKGTLNFSSTGAWTGNYGEASKNINIPAGSTFELRFTNGNAALNVDWVTFVGRNNSGEPDEPANPDQPVAPDQPDKPSQPDGPSNGRDFVFGLEADGTLYHKHGGHSGNWVYLCIDSYCTSATRNGDRWETKTGKTSGKFNLEFKIQDNAKGQCIYSANGIQVGSGVNKSTCF